MLGAVVQALVLVGRRIVSLQEMAGRWAVHIAASLPKHLLETRIEFFYFCLRQISQNKWMMTILNPNINSNGSGTNDSEL